MVNAEGARRRSSPLVDTEITPTRRLGSAERPGYIPLVSPNHPLLRVVAGVCFFHAVVFSRPGALLSIQHARSKLNAFQP